MSKIICDVCGTSFPDSANQCPICGCAASTDNLVSMPQDNTEDNSGHGSYTYVKGGRFSKANVKKRNSGKHTAKTVKTEKTEKVEKSINAEAPEKKKKSNVGLIIAVIALSLAIIAVALYITFTFFIHPAAPNTDDTTTVPPTTQAPTTEPTVLDVPCEDLTCPITLELYEEGEQVRLEVTVLPADTTDVVSYTSGDEAVVTVDAEGVVTAVAPGETSIEVVCGEKKAICKVICDFEAKPDTDDEDSDDEKKNDENTTGEGSNHLLENGDYKFNTFDHGPDFSLYPNNSHELVLRDKDNNVVEITITSQTPGIVSVNGNVVKAVGPGNGKLIVRFGDGENDFFVCEVIVWKPKN